MVEHNDQDMRKEPVQIERWNVHEGKWVHHATYLNLAHAEQNIALMISTSERDRWRIKPKDEIS